MLHRELVESLETDAAGAQGLNVRRLTAHIDQCLTGGPSGYVELGHHGGLETGLHLGSLPNAVTFVAQDEVVANTGSGQLPDAVDGFAPRRLEAEVVVAVVPQVGARAVPGVDGPERSAQGFRRGNVRAFPKAATSFQPQSMMCSIGGSDSRE